MTILRKEGHCLLVCSSVCLTFQPSGRESQKLQGRILWNIVWASFISPVGHANRMEVKKPTSQSMFAHTVESVNETEANNGTAIGALHQGQEKSAVLVAASH